MINNDTKNSEKELWSFYHVPVLVSYFSIGKFCNKS